MHFGGIVGISDRALEVLFGIFKLCLIACIERCDRITLMKRITGLFVQYDSRAEIQHVLLGLSARAEKNAGLARALCIHGGNVAVTLGKNGGG